MEIFLLLKRQHGMYSPKRMCHPQALADVPTSVYRLRSGLANRLLEADSHTASPKVQMTSTLSQFER
ncbi:unnamed protein product [Dibothriocephalus latus]|uniref:Uncharacterized protein n=1 Tax=Dibothriocephalus latus TaxID=60516 RepID=A0A3P7NKN1_DIBLA|nr:unnamed protein product [Dibothriocephalus latus]